VSLYPEMKKISLLFVLLLSQLFAFAQDRCGTEPPTKALYDYLEQIGDAYRNGHHRVRIDSVLDVPLKMHIVTSPSGSKYSYNTMLTVICELNTKYQPAGIRFYLHSVNYIADPSLYTHFSFQTGSQMMEQFNEARVVNVYFVDLGSIGLCGYAFFPNTGPGSFLRNGGLMMSVPCSQIGNTTLAHEMGHYLALPHPFDDTSNDPSSPISERVTRNPFDTVGGRFPANCTWAGDRFCDTRADFISTRWSCAGNPPVQLDVNGDQFDPDETLYMSYSLDQCANRFSEEQIMTMRTTLLGNGTTQGSRQYLIITPMPAADPITANSTVIEPNNPNTIINSDWAFFKWTKAPGASQYLFRILRNGQMVEEIVVADTQYVYTGFRLTSGAAYTWNVRPFNHAYTCMPASANGQFRAGQNFGTSVRQLESDAISLYPTLLEEGQLLQIGLDNLAEESLQFELYDLQGRRIKEMTLFGETVQRISLEGLSQGLYQVRISGDGILKHGRIVKQ